MAKTTEAPGQHRLDAQQHATPHKLAPGDTAIRATRRPSR
jgi:hypothetical protein